MTESRLVLQQIITGRETKVTIDGKSVKARRMAAIVLDEGTGEIFVVPWNPKTGQPILSIDTLRKLHPGLAAEARQALKKAPRQRVKR